MLLPVSGPLPARAKLLERDDEALSDCREGLGVKAPVAFAADDRDPVSPADLPLRASPDAKAGCLIDRHDSSVVL